MQRLFISADTFLFLEPSGKDLRMVLANEKGELACHKVSQKVLSKFLNSENAHLFNGRLQLDKNKEVIAIILKNGITGIIEAKDLRRYIDLYKWNQCI